MAGRTRTDSGEQSIRRAKEEIGEETLAKLRNLPAEVLRSLLKPTKHAGGRPKGSGMDLAPALLRMAELQEKNGAMTDREASRLVASEMQTIGLHVNPDTIRKRYRPEKAALRSKVRERPRFWIAAHLAKSTPEMRPPTRQPDPEQAVQAFVRELERQYGKNFEELKQQVFRTPPYWLDAYRDMSKALADQVKASVGQSVPMPLAGMEEQMKQLRAQLQQASRDALRGVEIILGRKLSE
jgi:hypothetical protein